MILLLLLATLAHAKDLARDPALFHSGTRAHLDEDIAAGTVPAKAWDEYVFGKTNFDLPDYRKGLYGAETLAATSLYSLYGTLGGDSAWVMRIHLKPECVTPEALYAEDYLVLDDPAKGGRFSRWYNGHRDRYRALENDCLIRFYDQATWETGAPYDVSQSDPDTQRLTRLCTPVLAAFLDDTKVKLVADAVNDDSWYLRDRACIASIDGSADQLFLAILDGRIGDPENDFVRNFYGDAASPGTFYSGNTFFFLSVAAETKLLTSASLPRLAALADSLAPGAPKAPEKLRLDNNADNVRLLALAVRAIGRAVKNGHVATLQKSLASFVAGARERMARQCDGRHGVKNEKRAACDHATAELSSELVKILGAR